MLLQFARGERDISDTPQTRDSYLQSTQGVPEENLGEKHTFICTETLNY